MPSAASNIDKVLPKVKIFPGSYPAVLKFSWPDFVILHEHRFSFIKASYCDYWQVGRKSFQTMHFIFWIFLKEKPD